MHPSPEKSWKSANKDSRNEGVFANKDNLGRVSSPGVRLQADKKDFLEVFQ